MQGGGRFAGGDESKDKQGLNEVASSFLGRRNRGRGRKLVSSVYRTSFLPRPFSPLPRPQDPARRYFFSFSPSGLEESGGKEEEMVWGNGWWCFKSVFRKKKNQKLWSWRCWSHTSFAVNAAFLSPGLDERGGRASSSFRSVAAASSLSYLPPFFSSYPPFLGGGQSLGKDKLCPLGLSTLTLVGVRITKSTMNIVCVLR